MKGLVIDSNYENAKNIKIIAEYVNKDLQLELLNQNKAEFCLIDASKYDFIITSAKPVNARVLISKLRPFFKVVLDKSADNIILSRYREIRIVDRNRILGIEVLGKNCYIHTTSETLEVDRITLTNLLDILETPHIVRCHKSFAVNVKYVKGLERETKHRWRTEFIIETDFECFITEVYIKEVMEKCVKYNNVKASKKIGY